jgi:hypothetical protein
MLTLRKGENADNKFNIQRTIMQYIFDTMHLQKLKQSAVHGNND